VLEVEAPPGTAFYAEVTVETNIGRRFVYRARTTATERGIARLTVPYATDTDGPTRALGPYRVRLGDRDTRRIDVLESEVDTGALIALPLRDELPVNIEGKGSSLGTQPRGASIGDDNARKEGSSAP
jgi:hypothetical protein